VGAQRVSVYSSLFVGVQCVSFDLFSVIETRNFEEDTHVVNSYRLTQFLPIDGRIS
jgi:hypothetical protein